MLLVTAGKGGCSSTGGIAVRLAYPAALNCPKKASLVQELFRRENKKWWIRVIVLLY